MPRSNGTARNVDGSSLQGEVGMVNTQEIKRGISNKINTARSR